MSAVSKKSKATTLKDSRNAISLPESACGATLLERLDGQTMFPFGQAPVPARVSVQAGKGEALAINVTYGLHGSGSYKSAVLKQSLVSRLRQKTDLLGSTLYRLKWKERATPSGKRIYALRASALPISASDYTSWPTPCSTGDTTGGGGITQALNRAQGKRRPSGAAYGSKLKEAVLLAAWPTPTTQTGDYQYTNGERNKIALNLSGAAKLATWPTPQAIDAQGKGRAGRLKKDGNRSKDTPGSYRRDLKDEALLAAWPTPTTCDGKGGGTNPHNRADILKHAVLLTASGAPQSGCTASTKGSGQLNPAHSRWLMGLPPDWDDCAAMVTRSTRKSPRGLSKPTSK
jgi:hypothetical protein